MQCDIMSLMIMIANLFFYKISNDMSLFTSTYCFEVNIDYNFMLMFIQFTSMSHQCN
jgi:hypothetical protein